MKPEIAEKLFIEELFEQSISHKKIENQKIENIEKLTGDASTRKYYRINSSFNNYVVCLDNPITDPKVKNLFVEVQEYLNANDIRVPLLYDKNFAKGYLLEEDLGDITYLQYMSNVTSVENEFKNYKDIIDLLIKIHSLKLDNVNKDFEFLKMSFDEKKLNDEIQFTTKYFCQQFLGIQDQKYVEEILKEYEIINKRLASKDRVFTHRDFHSRNIMVKNNEFVVIDFQDSRMGIPQYDLASILDDCYYMIHPDNHKKLLEYYYSNISKIVKDQRNYDEFYSLYTDMVMQRAFKAIGSFSYIYKTRNDLRYLKYIGFVMEKLKTYMNSDSRYFNLKNLLFRIYYES
jgi:aminoglycoside/choline kinase family phosphotransferase